MEVLLWEILVPTVRRVNGKPYKTRFHKVWDAKIREIAGGLTIFTPAKGQWISPDGETFSERMIPVRIACTRAQIDKIVDFTLGYYDQLAVMAYCVSSTCIIRSVEDVEKSRKVQHGKEDGRTSPAIGGRLRTKERHVDALLRNGNNGKARRSENVSAEAGSDAT